MSAADYAILGVPHTATKNEIKQAYHRLLLAHHPDKNRFVESRAIGISEIKQAYLNAISSQITVIKTGPRPAQVVSLEEFSFQESSQLWTYSCRCGNSFRISEADMDLDNHLISCESCSETVWVGYELAEEDKDDSP